MKPTIALFLYDPKCSVQSGNGILKALEDHYHFKIFSKNELEDNFFDDVDIVAVPGGFGDADTFSTGFKHNAKRVRKFVQQGGKYLGICMGAYWAGHHYFNILKDIDVVQYIKQDACTLRPHAKNMPIHWKGQLTDMFFYDGPTYVGSGNYELIATYASYNHPMAIIQDNIGLIGCHPEAEQFWYDSYSYMKGKYNSRHNLLLEFVDQLNTG